MVARMNNIRLCGLILLILLCCTGRADGQRTYMYHGDRGRLSAGLHAGALSLLGDNILELDVMLENVRPGGGVALDYRLNPALTLGTRLMMGQLSGISIVNDDLIQTDIYEANLLLQARLNGWINPDAAINQRLRLYAFAGAGALIYFVDMPVMIDDGFSVVFPVGIGASFAINQRWSIFFESGNRFTLTDNLDGTPSGPDNDAFNYTLLGVSFRLFPIRNIFPCHF